MAKQKILSEEEAHKLAEDPSTSASTLSHIVQTHEEHPHIVQAIAKHPNADAKTLHHAFHTQMADSALNHPNVSSATVDDAYNQLVKPTPVGELEDEHGDIIMNPKLSHMNREYAVSRIMDDPKTDFKPRWILNRYFNSDLASPDMIYKGMSHPDENIKDSALKSKMITNHHIDNAIVDKLLNYGDATTLVNNKNTSPESIKLLYEKFHNKAPKDDYWHDSLEQAVVSNPHTPTDTLKKIYSNPERRSAEKILSHPNYPLADVLKEFKNAKDKGPNLAVFQALANRPDTPEETLRKMDKKAGSKIEKWGWANDMLKHPNYPEDLQILRSRDSAHAAYSVLKRPKLSEVVLRSLANHKNANVVEEALKHKSVTPNVVSEAFNRKSKDVSTLAAKHPMLPADLKMQGIFGNPEAARHAAVNSTDPIVLQQIHEKYPENDVIKNALMNNKHIDPSVLDKLVNDRHGKTTTGMKEWPAALHQNPNLSKESAMKMAESHNQASNLLANHYGFNDKEMEQILDHHNRLEGHQSTRTLGARVMVHPNVSPDLLSKIVSGQWGDTDVHHIGEDKLRQFVAENPDVYNKDVVTSALNAPHELTDKLTIGAIARATPHLSEKEINNFVRGSSIIPAGHDSRDHAIHIAGQMLHNDNVDPKLLNSLIGENMSNPSVNKELAPEAASSEKVPIEQISDYLSNPVYQTTAWPSAMPALLNRIKEHDDPSFRHSLLENSSNPNIVNHLLKQRDAEGMDDAAFLESALKNPHPEVIDKVLGSQKLRDVLSGDGRNHDWMSEEKLKARNAIDSLADSEDSQIIGSAFPLMTPEAQEKVLRGRGLSQVPELIHGLSSEALQRMKIEPGMDQEVVNAILDHPNSTEQQFHDAVDHSYDSATDARIKVRKAFEAKSNKINRDALHSIDNKVVDKYPDMPLSNNIARHTTDQGLLDRIMSDDKFKNLRHSVAKNENVKTKHLDSFIGIRGPENENLAQDLAENNKSSIGLLSHIAKTYPDLAEVIASHPKATSSKVYPYIINSKNESAIGRLINNPSLPPDVRDELTKDPSVYLGIKDRDLLNTGRLSDIAHGSDPKLVARAISKTIPTTEAESAVRHAINTFKGDDLELVCSTATVHNCDLSPETQRMILDHNPQSSMINEMLEYQEDIPDDILSKALTAYNTPTTMGFVISHINKSDVDQINKIGETTRNQILENIDFDHQYTAPSIGNPWGGYAATILLNKLSPENVSKVDFSRLLDRLEASKNEEAAHSNGKLAEAIAKISPDKYVNRLLVYPEIHPLLIDNPNLSKENYDHLVDSFPVTYTKALKKHFFTGDYLGNLINHRHSSSESLQKINDLAKGAEGIGYAYKNQIAANSQVSDHLFKQLFDEGVPGALTQARIGPNGVKDKIEEFTKNLTKNEDNLEYLMENPHFKVGDFINSAEKNGGPWRTIQYHLQNYVRGNVNASEENIDNVVDFFIRHKFSEGVSDIAKHPNASAKALMSLWDKGQITKSELYHSAKVGGQLWRSVSHPFPSVPGVKTGKEINEASFTPQLDKMKAAAAMLPPDGFVEWAQFKKDNPALSGNPSVQKMFTSAPKQRLTAEGAAQYIANAPKKQFHISYGIWTGMQRHNNSKQLVIQINNGPSQDAMMQTDPNTFKLYKLIQNASIFSSHPVNPQSIGWSRVDTSNKDHWFVDEIQSDLNSGISRELAKLKEHEGAEEKLKAKYGLTMENCASSLNKVLEVIHGWEQAVLENVIQTAQAHGVKKVSIQSGKSKTFVNKGENAEVTNKYDKIYNKLPENLGFQKDTYNSLPSGSSALKNKPIWTIDVPAPAKKSELVFGNLSKSSLTKIIEAAKNLSNSGGSLHSLKEYSPEAYEAAVESIKALSGILKDAGFKVDAASSQPPAQEPQTFTPPNQSPELPKASSNDPETHGKLVFGPGAVRNYGGSDERQKQPSGDWAHVSRQGDESKYGENS